MLLFCYGAVGGVGAWVDSCVDVDGDVVVTDVVVGVGDVGVGGAGVVVVCC